MADQRITQLNELSKAGVSANDVLPIVHISETRKVTAKNLVAAGIDLVDNGEIDLAKLDQNSATKLGTAALADDAVTYAKLQNVSATDRLLGRSSAGAGNVEEIPLTAAGRALLDDADAAAQRTTLGLGTLATQSGTFSGTHSGASSGTNTGDQTITLTGDVTGSGTGSFAATIANDAVTYAKIQNTATSNVVLGRSSAGGGNVEEIACTAAGRALLDDANTEAQRTTLGLGTIATQNANAVAVTGGTATLSSLSANSVTISGGTITGITDLAVADGGTGASNAASARANLGLVIGTDVQAYDAGLDSIAGLTTAADQTLYTTDVNTYAVTSLTAAGRALIGDATAADQRTTLGLGTLSTQNASNISITGGTAVLSSLSANSVTISGGTISGITDLTVADGGTGASDAATARSNLGLTIGTNVQAYDAGLNSIAGLTTAANQTVYTTGADTYAVTGLTAAGRALLDDATAADQRTTLGLGSVATANQVSTAQIQDDAVTAEKLANESTVDFVTTLPASGKYIGQLARVTSDNSFYCWDGATWVSIKAAGSVNAIVGGTSGVVNVTTTASGDTVTISTTLDNTSAAGQFLAGPSSAAGSVTYRTIAGADLPTATTGAKGGVIVNGNGLRMIGDTIAINNSLTSSGSAYHVVQYNGQGLVTAGRSIIAADVPLATSSTIGVVRPGDGLAVDGSGTLDHTNQIASGTGIKVTFDANGHVTSTASLIATDIPELDASKITTGTFASARLAPNSVTASQLADYGIAQVSSSQPVPEFAGQLWINPTDRTAYVWVGQVSPAQGYYLPLNNEFGAQANLRFGGTYNASTNTISSLNTYGSSSGLTVGSALVAPTSASSGLYLLVTTAGTGTSPAPTVALDVGDWILSPGSGTAWTHVNIVGAGISVVDAGDVTFSGGALSPPMTGVADAEAALTTLWGRSQIATPSTLGIVLETTEIAVNNTTGAMTVGVVDEGTY